MQERRLRWDHGIWIGRTTIVEPSGSGWKLITPFLDPSHDYIEVYLDIQKDGKINLSDDSVTMHYLWLHGMQETDMSVRKMVRQVIRPLGVSLNKGEALEIQADFGNYGEQVHSFIQACLAVYHLVYLVRFPHVESQSEGVRRIACL